MMNRDTKHAIRKYYKMKSLLKKNQSDMSFDTYQYAISVNQQYHIILSLRKLGGFSNESSKTLLRRIQ